jgi:hypothetical protein
MFKNAQNDTTQTIDDVYYSEDTNMNVLSIQKLISGESTAKMKGKDCIILRNGIKIMKAQLGSDNLYYLSSHSLVTQPNKLYFSRYEKDIYYWHNLFGHLNPRAIVNMAKEEMIEGMPSHLSMAEWKGCTHCTESKSTKRKRKRHTKYNQNQRFPSTPGDTWHSDQKGPITPISIHKNRYCILFIDDATGYTECVFASSLTETEDTYNNLSARVKTLFGRNIKRFVCDGHGTYTSGSIMTQMEKDGTEIRVRAPHDPNGNTLSERTIRTIFEMARVLLNSAGFPKNRWEEAISHAVWIRNRSKTA